jgi:hypothetical protein
MLLVSSKCTWWFMSIPCVNTGRDGWVFYLNISTKKYHYRNGTKLHFIPSRPTQRARFFHFLYMSNITFFLAHSNSTLHSLRKIEFYSLHRVYSFRSQFPNSQCKLISSSFPSSSSSLIKSEEQFPCARSIFISTPIAFRNNITFCSPLYVHKGKNKY